MNSKYDSAWGGAMEEYQEGLGRVFSHTRFEVDDDSKIRFWHDV